MDTDVHLYIKVTDNKIEYYLGDRLHRENGPAIIYNNGTQMWYHHGRRHRDNGPAIEMCNGYKEWFYHGRRHRIDGPAIEWGITREWWVDGQLYTESEFNSLTNR